MESEHYDIYGVISSSLGPTDQVTSSRTDANTATI